MLDKSAKFSRRQVKFAQRHAIFQQSHNHRNHAMLRHLENRQTKRGRKANEPTENGKENIDLHEKYETKNIKRND